MSQYNFNFINAVRDVTCNEVLFTLVNLCDKRVSVCHGCNGSVTTNGLPFPQPYDLVAAIKKRKRQTTKTVKSRCLQHRLCTFMYFTRIRSPFHSSVFDAARWHSEWILSSCIGILLKACRMFIKFIYNAWVCQYQMFYLILSTNDLYLYKHISLVPYWANIRFLDP